MTHIILGTAGHIDHGKTALVRALTGVDTDRLQEEKRRGISIDIGFARLDLYDGSRIGIVDVPGHERFIKNMLAGIGGIDAVLFLIAANESIQPQTREHFDICRLLGIANGIVVLTKADLVDPDVLALARMEAAEFVAGSFLEDAPILPVSAVTGQGLPELSAEIALLAARVPPKNNAGPFRLPVDRAFQISGFGTVATGTLVSGSIRVEDEVELQPAGKRLRARNLQVHGEKADRASAGQRIALNLPGIEVSEIGRGMWLTTPGRFLSTDAIDCRVDLLPSSPPLKHNAPVHFYSGTAEIEAQLRIYGPCTSIQGGESAFARIILREAALLLPGDRFILRRFSPVTTIGGGLVLDVAIGHPAIRYRKSGDFATRLASLSSADPAERVRFLVSETSPTSEPSPGISLAALRARTGLSDDVILRVLRADPSLLYDESHQWAVSRTWIETETRRLESVVRDCHSQHPLQPGCPKESLRLRAFPAARDFPAISELLLQRALAANPNLIAEGEFVRFKTHRVRLQADQSDARQKIEAAFETVGLAVPAVEQVLAGSGVEISTARALLQILSREKRLVRVSVDLVFHATALQQLKATFADKRGQRFSVPQFKDWTGISRKFAIPLLEYLDREHITRREGDQRLVL